MTPEQITLVQASFRPVAALGQTAAAFFYARLFEKDPALRPMFPAAGLEEQSRKLVAMLAAAVQGLSQPERLLPVLADLGRRHVGYGVRPEHYDTVGAALLDTLSAALGPDFTPRTRDAWATAYGLIARTMQDAAGPMRQVA